MLHLESDGLEVVGTSEERSEFSLLGGEYRKRATIKGHYDVERQHIAFVKTYSNPVSGIQFPITYEGLIEGSTMSGRWSVRTSSGTWVAERQPP